MPKSAAYAIMSVDPGGTTGLATALVDLKQPTVASCVRRAWRKGNLRTWTCTGDHIEQAWYICRYYTNWIFNIHIEQSLVQAHHDSFVIESFQLRQMGADMSPVRIKAGIEVLLAGAYGVDSDFAREGFYVEQSASSAKAFVTDDMLKRWDMWRNKTPHERDALRHLARRIDSLMTAR